MKQIILDELNQANQAKLEQLGFKIVMVIFKMNKVVVIVK